MAGENIPGAAALKFRRPGVTPSAVVGVPLLTNANYHRRCRGWWFHQLLKIQRKHPATASQKLMCGVVRYEDQPG